MPCFKGLAVSIHTPDGPLPEYSIQKNGRTSRIASYIPVPPGKVPEQSLTGLPEQSTFAVSITLLTPGIKVPYTGPKPSGEDPHPQGGITVGGLPGSHGVRGRYEPVVPPYIPRTTSPNETLAAYIYFDGRGKEEVATLLRRGEETWVNSRWVSVPDSEGGGLAEREFLFKEVGLERWLNGLDLQGKDKAARIERRQRRFEKKKRIKKESTGSDDDEEEHKPAFSRNGVLRYSNDASSPTENVMQEDGAVSSGSDSDDEPPEPETTGQIKVALFRVLASGEIKRGEYEAQFDAHDDEDGADQNGGDDGDIDHTTSFAKPKTLDPKSISTQTVTGLDSPDSPYATFTFLYRGGKQLRKMGIIDPPDSKTTTPAVAKRKSISTDFSKLGPLNKFGTVGFSSYRDTSTPQKKTLKDVDAMDSDNEDEDDRVANGDDPTETLTSHPELLSPEDALKQGELTDGVQRIKLKRAHSAEGVSDSRKSPHLKGSDSPNTGTPQSGNSGNSTTANAGTPPDKPAGVENPDLAVASPYKKQRASMSNIDTSIFAPLDTTSEASKSAAPTFASDVSDVGSAAPAAIPLPAPTKGDEMDDEEL